MSGFTSRQQDIIEASIELIARKGIQELTIKNLARSIGISEPAIYRHFDSKVCILLAILDYFQENTQAAFQEIFSQGLSPLKELEQLFLTRFRQFSQKPALAAVVFSEEIFQNEPRVSQKVFEIMQSSQEKITTIIDQGQKRSELRHDVSKEQLALMLMGSMRLIVTQWRLSRFAFNLEDSGAKLWQSVARLIC